MKLIMEDLNYLWDIALKSTFVIRPDKISKIKFKYKPWRNYFKLLFKYIEVSIMVIYYEIR